MLTPPSIGSIQRDTCIADMPLAPITSVNAGKDGPIKDAMTMLRAPPSRLLDR